MATRLPNYCGPHGERYSVDCPGCVREWLQSLSQIERALIDYRRCCSLRAAKKLVNDFRSMEAA